MEWVIGIAIAGLAIIIISHTVNEAKKLREYETRRQAEIDAEKARRKVEEAARLLRFGAETRSIPRGNA